MTRVTSRMRLRDAAALLSVWLLASTAGAQMTGMIHGKVVDAKDQPIEGAKISIQVQEGSRHFDAKTNKKGEFVQIGLVSGTYTVTAEKEGIGTQSTNVQVSAGTTAEVTFKLLAPSAGGGTDPAKIATLKKSFDEGVALSKAGNYDGAVAKFTETAAGVPNCYDCYYNIGTAYAQKRDFVEAEAAFKKAIEMKPDYAAAFNGLATIYNAQKKYDEAAAASAKALEIAGSSAASGGGNADAMYNQGVIFWNAGRIAEAKKQFEDVIKLDPNHAEAHYQLGMALLNEGKMPEAVVEFEKSLALAPEGAHAAQAKALVEQLKK